MNHFCSIVERSPAVILAIKGYEKEHFIKLVHKESREYLSKIKATAYEYREIKSMVYNEEWNKLEIEYFLGVGEETRPYEIFFKDPKSVLVRMTEELQELVSKGQIDTNLIGEIGELCMVLYKKEYLKEKLSEILGVSKDKLEVKRTATPKWGPDIYVYYEGKPLAIIDVKTTMISDRYPKVCLNEAIDCLKNKYFT